MGECADRTKGVSEFTGAHNAWNPVAEQPAEPPVAADAAAVPANEADVNDGEDMRESSGSDDDSSHHCNACHQRLDHLGVCVLGLGSRRFKVARASVGGVYFRICLNSPKWGLMFHFIRSRRYEINTNTNI